MNWLSNIIIALCLAMDAFSVAIAGGSAIKERMWRSALLIAAAFGTAQAVMPLVGCYAGDVLMPIIHSVKKWLPFGIFSLLGLKMLWEGCFSKEAAVPVDLTTPGLLSIAAFATSIDALGVGITFAALEFQPLRPALVIGGITFCLSLMGALIGKHMGRYLGRWGTLAAGAILIGIAVKSLQGRCFL